MRMPPIPTRTGLATRMPTRCASVCCWLRVLRLRLPARLFLLVTTYNPLPGKSGSCGVTERCGRRSSDDYGTRLIVATYNTDFKRVARIGHLSASEEAPEALNRKTAARVDPGDGNSGDVTEGSKKISRRALAPVTEPPTRSPPEPTRFGQSAFHRMVNRRWAC